MGLEEKIHVIQDIQKTVQDLFKSSPARIDEYSQHFPEITQRLFKEHLNSVKDDTETSQNIQLWRAGIREIHVLLLQEMKISNVTKKTSFFLGLMYVARNL